MALRERSRVELLPGLRSRSHEQPGVAVGRRQHEAGHRPCRLVVPLWELRARRIDPLHLRTVVRPELGRADHERDHDPDRAEHKHDATSFETRTERLRPALVVAWTQRNVFLAGDEARVVLVDIELALEPERVGVVPQEALDVRGRGQQVELLVLERLQVLAADLRLLLQLRELELLAQARFAKAVSDLEHGFARL